MKLTYFVTDLLWKFKQALYNELIKNCYILKKLIYPVLSKSTLSLQRVYKQDGKKR